VSNSKISALTSATTPLAGTEVLPIVQSGTTVKVATDDLTVRNIRSNATTGILQITGPAAASTRVATVPNANWTAARTDAAQSFTGDQTLSTGNLVQGTAAKGFNFTANTPLAGMTSQLLNWYETGTYTPTVTASSGTLTTVSASGSYTRIGRQVTFNLSVTLTNIGTASGALIVTLPYTCGVFPAIGAGREDQNTGTMLQARIQSSTPGSTIILAYNNTSPIANGNIINATITYFV
jgi:hypothetical protein